MNQHFISHRHPFQNAAFQAQQHSVHIDRLKSIPATESSEQQKRSCRASKQASIRGGQGFIGNPFLQVSPTFHRLNKFNSALTRCDVGDLILDGECKRRRRGGRRRKEGSISRGKNNFQLAKAKRKRQTSNNQNQDGQKEESLDLDKEFRNSFNSHLASFC